MHPPHILFMLSKKKALNGLEPGWCSKNAHFVSGNVAATVGSA